MTQPRSTRWLSALFLLSLLWPVPVRAQVDDPIEPVPAPAKASDPNTLRREAARLAGESVKAFARGEYAQAADLLRRQRDLQPDNFVVHYNLACALAMQGQADEAAVSLERAVETGFSDIHHLRRDTTLAPLRTHPRYLQIINAWPAIIDAQRDARIEKIEAHFKGKYTTARDESLRLVYRSALDEKSLAAAREELPRLARFAEESVMPGILDPEALREDPWVMVILPTTQDFKRWAVSVYGEAAVSTTSMIGGSYEHDEKRLVSIDIGSTFRHEFFHVLHWRSCTRLGQPHPIWIMEGLCSLVEDYDLDDAGRVVPATSWRTNMAKRILRINSLLPIETIATMPQLRFSGSRPLAHYAQARAIFLFLHQSGRLKDWYAHYTANFEADPSGVASLEAVFGAPIKDINAQYRSWLKALPEVPEQIARGKASLGIEVDAGAGDGPVVAVVPRGVRPGELRMGDVIQSIDGRPTRDLAELVRVLGTCTPGQEVEVAYRRGQLHRTTKVTLIPRP